MPTPTNSSRTRSPNMGSSAVKIKIAVVAMATPSWRIQESLAPIRPTNIAKAKGPDVDFPEVHDQRCHPHSDQGGHDSLEPCATATGALWHGRSAARSMVPKTRPPSRARRMETAQAAVAAMTALTARRRSEVVPGSLSRRMMRVPRDSGRSSSPSVVALSTDESERFSAAIHKPLSVHCAAPYTAGGASTRPL